MIPARHSILKTGNAKNSVVSNGCLIEGSLEHSVVGRGCIIKKGAVIKNCVVLSDAYIGENVHIENQVVDKQRQDHNMQKSLHLPRIVLDM